MSVPHSPFSKQGCFLNERENQFSTGCCRGALYPAPTSNLNSNEKRRLPNFSIKNETALPFSNKLRGFDEDSDRSLAVVKQSEPHQVVRYELRSYIC